ncbi:MerR family transcriptional regulator [Nonomuraea sp. FMUSA5-5]|uniref:MerR family transcriptional regulator n=1 Tax=Nonomuraea composti TaxID=2720023 RepID=A0ABX1AYI2_9ACTN|nr:helix-turn-helix domain-containing protein [Nonomuraea sp. FMUSA5-5]NJP90675.1 MerR family transcriptional regulator [Nonomuraea sp. FMUSA5-5]
MSDTWTIGELAEHAARALRAGAPSPPNGRVRDVPSERLIRWYTTIGLVDPPLTRRGRIARYGRRHLLQLVAVKRLQAAGRSIAEIQVALAGATERMLESAAHLDGPLPAPATADGARVAQGGSGQARPGEAQAAQAQASRAQAADAWEGHREAGAPSRAVARGGGEPVRGRFWAERPGVGAAPAHPGQQPGALPSDDPARERGGDPAREHDGDPAPPGGGPAHEHGTQRSDGSARPAGTRPAATPPGLGAPGEAGVPSGRGAGGEAGAPPLGGPSQAVGAPDPTPSREPGARGEGGERVWGAGVRGVVVTGVRLGDGVRLLLDTGRVPSEEDVQAVLAAARPLLAVLEERELT